MSNEPKTIRDGSLKATIWENTGENGPFVSVELAKTYKDRNGDLQDGHSFSVNDLLKIGRLADKAYDRGRELQHELRREQQPAQSHNDDRRARFNEQRSTKQQDRGPERTR